MAEATSATAVIATEHGSRYLQQLAKHWAHKFTVEFDPDHGSIVNAEGKAVEMTATPEALTVTARAPDDTSLPQWRQVIEDHIARFGFRENLSFDWQPA